LNSVLPSLEEVRPRGLFYKTLFQNLKNFISKMAPTEAVVQLGPHPESSQFEMSEELEKLAREELGETPEVTNHQPMADLLYFFNLRNYCI
jgi:hypothetical protein